VILFDEDVYTWLTGWEIVEGAGLAKKDKF